MGNRRTRVDDRPDEAGRSAGRGGQVPVRFRLLLFEEFFAAATVLCARQEVRVHDAAGHKGGGATARTGSFSNVFVIAFFLTVLR